MMRSRLQTDPEYKARILANIRSNNAPVSREEKINEMYDSIREDRKYRNNTYLSEEFEAARAKRTGYRKELTEFENTIKGAMLESALKTMYNMCARDYLLTMSENTKALVSNAITSYIKESGVPILLNKMESKTALLSELAITINEKAVKMLEDVDLTDKDSFCVNSKEELDLYDNICGSEEMEDISDIIRMKVARAEEDFMAKNIEDSEAVKDIMTATKEKIESTRTGSDEGDVAAANEQTFAMKQKLRKLSERSHNVYEQMVINLAEAAIKDNDLKARFSNSDNSLNMNSIVETVNATYILHEMLTSLKLEQLNETYIESMITF